MKQFCTLLVFLFLAATAAAADFVVDMTYGGTLVQFESDGKLEFIAGKTKNLIGAFQFAPTEPQAGATGVMRVDLRTLKTGIDMRDEHMRENHLETDEFPYAWFELTDVNGLPDSLVLNEPYSLSGRGYFYLHGVKRPIDVDLTLTNGGTAETPELKVSAKFSLFLDDFEVERPRALFLKLAERIDLEVDFLASINNPLPDIVLPDWPERH